MNDRWFPMRLGGLRDRLVLALCLGLVACGGGSLCRGAQPSPTADAQPRPPTPPDPPVRLRDYLFPARSCSTTLRRSDDRSLETFDYLVERPGASDEAIAVSHRFTEAGHLRSESHVYHVKVDGIHRDGVLLYPLQVKALDLLVPRERIVTVTDRVAAAGGDLSPCITALSRRDSDLILRTYETWCEGVGVARVDRSLGKRRVISDFVATSCR